MASVAPYLFVASTDRDLAEVAVRLRADPEHVCRFKAQSNAKASEAWRDTSRSCKRHIAQTFLSFPDASPDGNASFFKIAWRVTYWLI